MHFGKIAPPNSLVLLEYVKSGLITGFFTELILIAMLFDRKMYDFGNIPIKIDKNVSIQNLYRGYGVSLCRETKTFFRVDSRKKVSILELSRLYFFPVSFSRGQRQVLCFVTMCPKSSVLWCPCTFTTLPL